MDRAEIALLLVDATEGIVDQDLHILEYAVESGTGIVLVANKWDLLDKYGRERFEASVKHKLKFAEWIMVKHVCATTGKGVKGIFPLINRMYEAGKFEVSTPELNRLLEDATRTNPPPLVRGRPIKTPICTQD